MSDDLAEIIAKCEQYWNEPKIGVPEVHSILEFIHQSASCAKARNAELLGLLRELRGHHLYHTDNCNSMMGWVPDCPCDCGTADFEARVRKALEGET